jgi:hypothetical protein
MLTTVAYLVLLQSKPVKLAPAVFSDASTRRIVEMSKSAFKNLKSAKLAITADGEKKTYAYAVGRIAGRQRGAEWNWSQKKLNLLCGKGFFRGTLGPYNVNAWLNKAGASPELMPVHLAARKNPIEILIPPGSRVRRAGTMSLNSVPVDIIEVKSPLLRVTMAIRQDNRLVADLRAVNVDRNGKVLFSSSRSFAWSYVNKPIASKEFAVGTGRSPKPIKGLK